MSDRLAAWLEAHVRGVDEAAVEALDLDAFLRDTAELGAPHERLRRLAIFVEDDLVWREQPRAWLAHERIYAAALRAGDDAQVQISRAVSAVAHADGLYRLDLGRAAWREAPLRRRMMAVAHAAAARAVELAPDDAGVLVRVGQVWYDDPDRGAADALPWFERALAGQGDDGRWAALYRAHCLHDLGRWAEAARAYDAVDDALFAGPRAWRREHLLEQRAYCRLRAGDVELARTEFAALLARWDRDPSLAGDAYGWHLAEAVRGPLRDLYACAHALFAREERADGELRVAMLER